MPEIPAKAGDWPDLFLAAQRLLFDPRSLDRTQPMVNSLEANAIAEVIRRYGIEKHPVTRATVELLLHAVPGYLPLPRSLDDASYGLMTAGHVLTYVLRLKRTAPRLASAETAYRIIERRYAHEKVSRASTTSIKAAWYEFRPVAHLLAAAVDQMPEAYEALKEIFPPFLEIDPEDHSRFKLRPDWLASFVDNADHIERSMERCINTILPRYFGFAEALRQAGEAFHSVGQEKTGRSLLDPATTWRLPAGFEVPAVTLQLPPLTETELEWAGILSRSSEIL